MYVCGPTVYDVPHLGHGRTAVVFDMMRRYLEWSGFVVTYVSNVTDVEDKIIARAEREGTSEDAVALRYEDEYWSQLARINVAKPATVPHATEYIDEMLELIDALLARGHAYLVPGRGVYFEVSTYGDYGTLAHRNLADLLEASGARVEVEEGKRSPVDFVLWKAAKPGEPTWNSPWGPGRPGWHIECSAMSLRILGDGFDLHGGGDDLRFPHHENERAQAEAAGHPFARHWVHSGMVNVGGEKMSKSLGNFTTLREALDAHDPRAFRLAVIRTHYRSAMELSGEVLRDAEAALERIDALARRVGIGANGAAGMRDDETIAAFCAAMEDDFNTPVALAAVFDCIRKANTSFDAGGDVAPLVMTARELLETLGIAWPDAHESDVEIDALVAARTAARAARDFAEADRIREELAARQVTIEDTPAGTIWHR